MCAEILTFSVKMPYKNRRCGVNHRRTSDPLQCKELLAGAMVAAILVIMLAVLPSVAYAHPGHDTPQARIVLADKDFSRSTPVGQIENLALVKTVQSLEAVDHADKLSASGCVGHCCAGASHACCGFTLPAGYDKGGPVFSKFSSSFANSSVASGLEPSALRKPPKSFV